MKMNSFMQSLNLLSFCMDVNTILTKNQHPRLQEIVSRKQLTCAYADPEFFFGGGGVWGLFEFVGDGVGDQRHIFDNFTMF